MMVAVRDTFPRHPDVSCEPLKKDSAADKKTTTVKAAGVRVFGRAAQPPESSPGSQLRDTRQLPPTDFSLEQS
jgi:hypothetical protein